ncbi:hypothetical protein [Spirosoma areae]
MKSFLILAIGVLLSLVLAQPDANAQTTLLPSANRIVYSTNAVEVQDSVKKVAYTFKKGTLIVQTKGFSGGSAVLVEAHSRQRIWAGPVNSIRIVGVASSDSLKVLSLKATPF